MLIPFTMRSKLLGVVEELALYNDKGIAWRKHDQAQANTERARLTAKIKGLTSKLGQARLPSDFVAALSSGALATDITGRYTESLRNHFQK